MCGIVGAFAFGKYGTKAEEKVRRESSIFITTQLLQKTVDRGKDATGVSLLWEDGNYTGLKMGIPAPDFIGRFGDTEKDYEGILKLWREYPKIMKIFFGHCRKSSVGNSYDNKNNHPIKVDDIMVIHNGTLTNHDIVFGKLNCKRHAEVDTEAIAHLLHKYTKNGVEPFTIEALRETCRRLQGTYSVLAASGNNPFQVAQFRDTKPAEMVLVKPLKTVFVASEEKFLKNILFEYNKLGKLFVTGGLKLPYIKKEDVDFVTLPDDTVALWDLTVEIDDKTAIRDLYDSEKAPLLGKRIWRTTSAAGGTSYNYYEKKAAEVKSQVADKKEKEKEKEKEKTDKDDKDDKDGDKDIDGLVWSKSLDKYKTQVGIDKTKRYKSVEIEVQKGEVTLLDSGDDATENYPVIAEDGFIAEVEESKVENLITGKAALTEHVKDNTITIREVDVSQDPEALKKAESFVEDGIVKYENDDEVADELDLSDVSVLKPLPIYALANRIKKFILKQGFVAGYICRKSEEAVNGSTDDQNKRSIIVSEILKKKLLRATKKISTLKTILRIASMALEGFTNPRLRKLADKTIFDELKKAKLDYESISKVFSVGDLENVILLKKIKTEIGSSDDQEKANSAAV